MGALLLAKNLNKFLLVLLHTVCQRSLTPSIQFEDSAARVPHGPPRHREKEGGESGARMVILSTCSDLYFLDDRHATPCSRGDEFEQVSRAEPQVPPDMVIRITDSGVVYKEIVNWCARSTFYSEKAAWKEFDRRTTSCLHVTSYPPCIRPELEEDRSFSGVTDLNFEEQASRPQSNGTSPHVPDSSRGRPSPPGSSRTLSPVLSRLAGDATWAGNTSLTHIVVGASPTQAEMPASAEGMGGQELQITLPGHDIPVALNPCRMCAQEAGGQMCPACNESMCSMCISFFGLCSQVLRAKHSLRRPSRQCLALQVP